MNADGAAVQCLPVPAVVRHHSSLVICRSSVISHQPSATRDMLPIRPITFYITSYMPFYLLTNNLVSFNQILVQSFFPIKVSPFGFSIPSHYCSFSYSLSVCQSIGPPLLPYSSHLPLFCRATSPTACLARVHQCTLSIYPPPALLCPLTISSSVSVNPFLSLCSPFLSLPF
jgi:hypothetical protein